MSRRVENPAADRVRYVLSETAVRRLRNADRVMRELWEKFYQTAPAVVMNDIAEAQLAVTEAVNEIGKSNVENAA